MTEQVLPHNKNKNLEARRANFETLYNAVRGTPAVVSNATAAAQVATPIAAATTLTAAQLLSGLIVWDNTAPGMALTLPTAASLVAAIPNCRAGDYFDVVFYASTTNAIVITAVASFTLVGSTALVGDANHRAMLVRCIVTNATSGTEAAVAVIVGADN